MNVFGEGKKQGLTNPLTEDLLADGFNALNFNEVHLAELHDTSGTGKIVVHEEFNMTNNMISNLADPVQNKDAANKQYVDNAVAPPVFPYDFMAAYSDETTQLGPALTKYPVVYQCPNDMQVQTIRLFLTTATTNILEISIVKNFALTQTITIPAGSLDTGDVALTDPALQYLLKGARIELYPFQQDPTATGIKLLLNGVLQ